MVGRKISENRYCEETSNTQYLKSVEKSFVTFDDRFDMNNDLFHYLTTMYLSKFEDLQ